MMNTTATCEELEVVLQEALTHLYAPGYHPPQMLCEVIACQDEQGAPAVRAAILSAIKDLEPPEDTPKTAYPKQLYDLLYHRFVLRLTQEETAGRLNVSRRTVNRLQHRAVHTLANALLGYHIIETSSNPQNSSSAVTGESPQPQAEDWQTQIQLELASLRRQSPNRISNVQEIINEVLSFLNQIPTHPACPIELISIQADLVTTIHPVAFRQVLISLIQRLARNITEGKLSIYARLEDGDVRITLTAPVLGDSRKIRETLLREMLLPENMRIEMHIDHGQAFVWIQAPSAGKIAVLLVDDNEDMARLYRDATIGTRYHISSVTTGSELLQIVEDEGAERDLPDVIVLDVMLPDIDGWRLLMRLHENERTRPIPVIIASVVREEELAHSLGASQVLTKPIRPRTLIAALDQACLQIV
jgi:CheY-like chemotaxis protein/transcriptional regulator with XRE-family HTH domain